MNIIDTIYDVKEKIYIIYSLIFRVCFEGRMATFGLFVHGVVYIIC